MRTLRSSMHGEAPSEGPPTSISPTAGSAMEDFLRKNGCFETRMGLDHRREVLHSLDLLVRQWIQSQTLEQGYHWQYANRVGGKIVTYGSYMLGISHQGADIDALFIAPSHITRENYFHSLFELFNRQREVTDLRAIEEAYVPVIKMKYDGIEIDMTFAKLNLTEIPPELDAFENSMLKNLDQKCVRSLNGYRSTKEILNLVPNVEVFRLALRAVKLWAKSQGIYSNIMGYLGGFSWAVLVAKTCIMHPEILDPERMVFRFFQVFSKWHWPDPVMLRPLEDDFENQSEYSMQSWNPKKNPTERFQVMPVITPTYPHLNSTFNVTQSTLKLVQDKMNSALLTCAQVLEGKETWDTLFKTRHIFHEFEHFLFVIASAYKPLLWFGLIESKIRHFVSNIERECPNLSGARIWPKPYTQVSDGKTIQLWFVGLHFQSSAVLDLARPLQTFRDHLSRRAQPFYTNDMCIYAELLHRAKVSAALSEADIHEIINSSQHRNQYTPQQQQQIAIQRQQLQQLNRQGSSVNSVREANKENNSYAAAVSKTQQHQIRHYPQQQQQQQQQHHHHHHIPHHYKVQSFPQTQRTFNTPPPVNNPTNGMITSVSSSNRQNHVPPVINPYISDSSPHIFERSWASNKGHTNLPPPHIVDVPSPPMTPISSVSMCIGSVSLTQQLSKIPTTSLHSGPAVSSSSVVSVAAVGDSRKSSEIETASSFVNDNNNGTDILDTSYTSSIDDTESCPRGSVSLSSDKFPPTGLVQARLHHTDTIPFSPGFASSPLWPLSPSSSSSPGSSVLNNNGASHSNKSAFPSSRPSGVPSTPRLSSSEIRDVPSPLPVHPVTHHPIRFNFTSSTLSSTAAGITSGAVTRVTSATNSISSSKAAVFH